MAQQPLVRLRLKKAGGVIGDEITVAALADLQDNPGETWGYDPNAFVYVPVKPNKRDPTSGSKEKRKICVSSVIVGQTKVNIYPPVRTILVNGNPVLEIKRIVFGERVRDYAAQGTGKAWIKGDGKSCGAYLRKPLERAGPDSEGELVKIALRSVASPHYEALPDCFLVLCDVAGHKGGTMVHYCCRGAPDDAAIKEECAVAAIGAALSYRNVPNIKEDSIYLKMSPRIQEATRKALEGQPYKKYDLSKYRVADLPGQYTRLDRDSKPHHMQATAEPRTFRSAPSRKVAHERGMKANPGAARNQEAKEEFIRDYNFYAERADLPLWDVGDVCS